MSILKEADFARIEAEYRAMLKWKRKRRRHEREEERRKTYQHARKLFDAMCIAQYGVKISTVIAGSSGSQRSK